MKVAFLYRHRHPANFSIEKVFEVVQSAMPPEVQQSKVVLPELSDSWPHRWSNIRAAGRVDADVLHMTGDAHYVAMGMPPEKTVLTIHDCNTIVRKTGLRREVIKKVYYDWPVARAGIITTISEFTKRQMLELVPCDPSKVIVVPNPVRTDLKFQPKPFSSDCPVFLQVGTKWNKNLNRVAEALSGIRCRLIVVGELTPEQQEALTQHKINVEGACYFSDEDLVEAYRRCDAVLFASIYEGFGMPILEANAIGRPVIAGDNTSMPEAAGGAACLVDANSVESIREGIQRIIDDASYRDALIEAGQRNVAKYQPASIAKAYLAVYNRLKGQSS